MNPTTTEEPRLLSLPEVARRLTVTRQTVYAMCKRGDLSYTRRAKYLRVPEAEVDAYIARNTHERRTDGAA